MRPVSTTTAPATERAHAVLAASSAHKWLVCTPSARLEEQFPDTGSDYAAEGTLAHAVAELKAKKHFTEPMGPRTFSKRLKELQATPLYENGQLRDPETYWPEILRYTDTYLDYLKQTVHAFDSPPYIAIEKRLDFSAWVPEGFGTGDCIIIGSGALHIVDLKYGKGVPVSAIGNPQMRLYALGAYAAYSFLFPIERVRMTIFQPRLDNVSEDEITIDELLAWGESIKPIAARAFAGEGEFVPGDHCRFCRARHTCRARADHYLQLAGFHKMKPPLISNEEVGQILEQARDLAKWVSDLEEYALSELLRGGEIPGWKAVEGRSSRQYTDIDAAFAHLTANGIDEAILYERKPLTVAQLEKTLGKAEYRRLIEEPGFVKVEPGKPTLAPAGDKRPAITNQVKAEDVFVS